MATAVPTITQAMLRFISGGAAHADLALRYMKRMLAHERQEAFKLAEEALDEGLTIRDLYLDVLQPVQYEIGWLWQTGKISVGHEHYCTNATQLLMASLYPRLFRATQKDLRMVAACAEGELHELGVRMLADFFEMEGWDTDFLGANTPRDGIVRMIEETGAEALAIGVSMHYHLSEVERVIEAVRKAFRGDEPIILVGGYPFRTVDNLWENVGADASAPDAASAVEAAEALVTRQTEAKGGAYKHGQ